MPRSALFLCIFSLASFALPGTNNFIGEFLILIGTSMRNWLMVVLAMGGIVLGAGYMLWMLQRVALGQAPSRGNLVLSDLTGLEVATLVPLVLVIFWIGLYPSPILEAMDTSVTYLVQQMQGVQPMGLSDVFVRP